MAKKNNPASTAEPDANNDAPAADTAAPKVTKVKEHVHLVLPKEYSAALMAASKAGEIDLDDLKAHLVGIVTAQDPAALADAVFEAAITARRAKLKAAMVPSSTPTITHEVDAEDVP